MRSPFLCLLRKYTPVDYTCKELISIMKRVDLNHGPDFQTTRHILPPVSIKTHPSGLSCTKPHGFIRMGFTIIMYRCGICEIGQPEPENAKEKIRHEPRLAGRISAHRPGFAKGANALAPNAAIITAAIGDGLTDGFIGNARTHAYV